MSPFIFSISAILCNCASSIEQKQSRVAAMECLEVSSKFNQLVRLYAVQYSCWNHHGRPNRPSYLQWSQFAGGGDDWRVTMMRNDGTWANRSTSAGSNIIFSQPILMMYTVSQKSVHLAWATLSAYHSQYTDSKSMKFGQINNLGPKFCLSLLSLKSVEHAQR